MKTALAVLCWLGVAHASIPEPDAVYFGTANLDGASLAANDEVTVFTADDAFLASYKVGQLPGFGAPQYLLRVPLVALVEGETVPPANRAAAGTGLKFFCKRTGGASGVVPGTVTIAARGTVSRLDLACAGGTVPTTTFTTSTTASSSTTATSTSTSSSTSSPPTSTPGSTTTTTTILAVCGDGTVDPDEECEPAEPACEDGFRCVDCQCAPCPSVTLDCAEWVASLEGEARRATIYVVAGGAAPVSGLEVSWDAEQTRIDIPESADEPSLSSACGLDPEQPRARCSVASSEAASPADSAVRLELSGLRRTASVGARFSVDAALDADGAAYLGCELPPDCCVVDADCGVGDMCGGTPSCGDDSRCVPAVPLTCDDTDACTVDTCDEVDGCAHEPLSCDDTDACTIDTCDEVDGCAHEPLGCDDTDACTVDTCDQGNGCAHAPLPASDGAAAVSCRIGDVQDLVPSLVGLGSRKQGKIDATLNSIDSLLRAAEAAPKLGKCKGKLKQALKKAKQLEKKLGKFDGKGLLGPDGADVLAVVAELRRALELTRDAPEILCGS